MKKRLKLKKRAAHIAHSKKAITTVQTKKATIIGGCAIVLLIILILALYIFQQRNQSVSPISNSEQSTASSTAGLASTTPPKIIPEYVKITGGCGPYYSGVCAKVYDQATTSAKVVAQLRNGIVLRVGSTSTSPEGIVWYKIKFEKIQHPDRVKSEWYIPEGVLESFTFEEGITGENATSTQKTKKIIVDISDQKLYAYEGDELFMETSASTGYNSSPTPIGTFRILRRTPSRYMQGPQPEFNVFDYFDLPGVPWTMYFDNSGNAIHGAYWHTKFGNRYSHGCVNLSPAKAEALYRWASLGTKVIVRE